MEPEYRSVTTPAGTERTTTARYPVVFGAMPVGSNFVVSLSASSLLDRTSTTSFNTTQIINGGDSVPMTTTYRIDGGIEDVRLAGGVDARDRGFALESAFTASPGSNLISLTQIVRRLGSVRGVHAAARPRLSRHGAVSVGVQLSRRIRSWRRRRAGLAAACICRPKTRS